MGVALISAPLATPWLSAKQQARNANAKRTMPSNPSRRTSSRPTARRLQL
jgi:hypothetical protein